MELEKILETRGIEKPEPVKLFCAVLYSDENDFRSAADQLTTAFGTIDFESEPIPFDHTDFYEKEMGAGLKRKFIAFEELKGPQILIEAKLTATEIETTLERTDGGRSVNIDPGTLDYLKVVLASFKYQGQKIFLGKGVWADLTMYYRKGGWALFEWTFPDFKTGRYDKILLDIRSLYKKQRLKLTEK